MKITCYNDKNNLNLSQELTKNISVFGSIEYASYLKTIKKVEVIWFLGIDERDNQFLITMVISKLGFLKKGKFITNIMCDDQLTLRDKQRFLDQVVDFIRQEKLCDWIGQGANWALFEVFPKKSIECPFGTYRVNLEGKNEEALLGGFNRKIRQYIRRGLKNSELEIKVDNRISNASMEIINEVLKNGNLKPISTKNILELEKNMLNNMKVYTAFLKGEPCASVVVYFNNYATYAAYSGRKYKLPQEVMPLLFWKVILDSLMRSSKFFDFVGALVNPEPGSKAFGIQSFKSKYGDFVQGYLWKIVINNTKYRSYMYLRDLRNLKKIFKGKRTKDIIDHERIRLIVKS